MTNPRFQTIAFQTGETVTLRAIITDNDPESVDFKERIDASGGVEVQITAPDDVIDTAFSAMTNIGTGVYEFNFSTVGKASGDWTTRFRATHTAKITLIDDTFRLEP